MQGIWNYYHNQGLCYKSTRIKITNGGYNNLLVFSYKHHLDSIWHYSHDLICMWIIFSFVWIMFPHCLHIDFIIWNLMACARYLLMSFPYILLCEKNLRLNWISNQKYNSKKSWISELRLVKIYLNYEETSKLAPARTILSNCHCVWNISINQYRVYYSLCFYSGTFNTELQLSIL